MDVMSPRQAELARTPLLQASLADRRTVALGDDAVNVVEASIIYIHDAEEVEKPCQIIVHPQIVVDNLIVTEHLHEKIYCYVNHFCVILCLIVICGIILCLVFAK